jgi:hypothetical protein
MRSRLVAFASVLVVVHGTATAQSVTLVDTAPLAAPRLREGSGLAATARPGVFWTHNDSGDEPVLYTTDSAGRDLGRIRVRGASAVDWEDIDAGPCVVVPGRCLYIGDIGDNAGRRPQVTVYRVIEPTPPADHTDTLRAVDVLDTFVIRYPDGPRDAESVIVTPDGLLLLVSKPRQGRPQLYWASVRRSGRVTMTAGAVLPIATSVPRGRLVTGGAISPDGRWVVLRTYVSLHFFVREGATTLRALTRPEGIPIPYVETQGEGVTFDGPDRLVLIGERDSDSHGRVVRLQVRLPAEVP